MIRNKRGEEMVEAAMVLPLVILLVLSMLLVMLHDYDTHREQLKVHKTMIASWEQPATVFDIQKKKIETSSKISGAVDFLFRSKKEYRTYNFSPAACIRLGEMIAFDAEE